MASAPLTIPETITEIRSALQDYVEAAYHVSHPAVVELRRALLEEPGVLFQTPYVESTPRYTSGKRFHELELPPEARALLGDMAQSHGEEDALLFDPPYEHQALALEATIRDGKSLVVTTGTGSGKTETFLLPIIAKLALEAEHEASFARSALRAVLLYPMNALVNDQLSRLRLLFGNPRVAAHFMAKTGRPARFARYTSRTLYPGVRTTKKDSARLRSIAQFYIAKLEQAADSSSPYQHHAQTLITNLRARGKWPAKPDLQAWFGTSGQHWQDSAGNFVRAVLGPEDPELLTRHEVLEHPPDILVTNYSMLEYMLMRPLERPVFEATRDWLAENSSERFMLIVDEAHLYRGAAGAEVGLLLRRLRTRLGIPPERLQVICTSASFHDPGYAREFAAQLTGKQPENFETITGKLSLRPNPSRGAEADAESLAAVPLAEYFDAEDDDRRFKALGQFLSERGVEPGNSVAETLYEALRDFPPMSLLVNATMGEAQPLAQLGREIFSTQDHDLADRALTALIALGSIARQRSGEPGLIPCRVHAFFRGLPGLWACIDPGCPGAAEHPDSPVGALYSQPRESCSTCGARVFELYTCRNCGAAYARAYTHDIEAPGFLWNEPGSPFEAVTGHVGELLPLDLLLEEPNHPFEPADLDVETGRLNPLNLGERMRQVFLKPDRSEVDASEEEETRPERAGEFRPCGVCGQHGTYGRSSVQDHQTKGDQPFQALVTRQIHVQPPGAQAFSEFAPLRGRKVLAFSDSRQAAARLAPNLQTYSMQDVLRPLVLRGWRELETVETLAPSLSLEDLHIAVLVGAIRLSVRLRPELKGVESMQALQDVAVALDRGAPRDPTALIELLAVRNLPPPESLLRGIVSTVIHRYYGLQALALASLRERQNIEDGLLGLPDLPGLAETEEAKLALTRLWITQWAMGPGMWFQAMGPNFWQARRGVRPHTGTFRPFDRWLADRTVKQSFARQWLPALLSQFCEQRGAPNQYRLRAATLALETGGEWAYCQACRATQRPFPGSTKCAECGATQVESIDPSTDPVFVARNGYYRSGAVRALEDPPDPPMAIIAAEHTAQLNAAQADDVFSKVEEHELLFQDVDLGVASQDQQRRPAIDVLSCTTTMEVGIDIGALSGVALRNMPPSRASYQQRSGRAGRRGNAIATVVAFGSADSHDEHYFSEPDSMIRGSVDDPALTLDNPEIARRHITAYLLQAYHEARTPEIDPEDQPQLFEVLGSVEDFAGTTAPINQADFGRWLEENEEVLKQEVAGWLPTEIDEAAREALLDDLGAATSAVVAAAVRELDAESSPEDSQAGNDDDDDAIVVDAPEEVGEERKNPNRSVENLLDRLLYRGVLPRYAFPTDVVAFHVFDRDRSTRFRPEFQYAPSQGLAAALSQYAPGKRVWIDGREWQSGALYSPMPDDRFRAWQLRQLYFECSVCHYAKIESYEQAERGELRDCPACSGEGTFGRAKNWLRPPGFAHPYSWEEETSPDDQPATSFATRAKLMAAAPADTTEWQNVTSRIREHYDRMQLLVTNTGPRQEGYTYCVRCGVIEPTAMPSGVVGGSHLKPFPDDRHPECEGGLSSPGLVLGTEFISDVLLIGLRVDAPLTLRPEYLATHVALRTLSEAFAFAATNRLQVEHGEVQAEYRPALTQAGREGLEAEIYLYDTLAGGAGFTRRIGELGRTLFDDTVDLLEGCPDGCDRSCYRCLRGFNNRFEHELLDRHLGASLLRYLVSGQQPTLDPSRLDGAADRLYADLCRQRSDGVEFQRHASIEVPGLGAVDAPIAVRSGARTAIVGVHGPLTPDFPADETLRQAKEFGTAIPVHLVDEIVIARNLPFATKHVLDAI